MLNGATPGFPYGVAIQVKDRAFTRSLRRIRQVLSAGNDVPKKPEALGELGAIPTPEGAGICLSGGGIRAASFGLGALQSFGRGGFLYGPKKVKYLTAVSGGSYIATAFAMIAKQYYSSDRRLSAYKPFAHGSPEELYLRDHSQYFTHGQFGVTAVIWRVFLGIVFNIAMFLIALSFLGVPLGYLYRLIWPSLRAGCLTTCLGGPRYSTPDWLVVLVPTVAGVSILIGIFWLALNHRTNFRRRLLGFTSGILIAIAAVTALIFIGFPAIIHLARAPYKNPGKLLQPAFAHNSKVATGVVGATGVLSVITAWLAAAQSFLTSKNPLETSAVSRLRTFASRHKVVVVNAVATVGGPVLVLIALLYWAYWASAYSPFRHGTGLAFFVSWLGALVVFVLFWFRADVTAWSLFPFYRRRLSAAFVLERGDADIKDTPTSSSVDGVVASERNYTTPYWLSTYQADEIPEVIICAAANISNYGETPTGTHVSSFTFSSLQIGGPLVGAESTATYEDAVRSWKGRKEGRNEEDEFAEPQARFVTFPSAMAISGAAFAPSMGKMTRGPYRFFISLLNLRLGVWVPNPRFIDDFNRRRSRPLLPRPQYLLREMLGLNTINAPFLYVTDGGHYENLGLVELLRRRCKEIWCVDASGDQIDTFDTLGGALRMAQSELQVRVDIDPVRDMGPFDKVPGSDGVKHVRAPYCKGTIYYPDSSGNENDSLIGTLYYVKLGVPNNAPWSVRSYASSHPVFPCDPTTDQLYDADRFEAYRELGSFIVDEAQTEMLSQ